MGSSGFRLLSDFLLPPLNILLVGIAGVLLLRSRPRAGKLLIILALGLLYVLSTPHFAARLLTLVEPTLLRQPDIHDKAQAIVVLGAGSYLQAPEYGADTVNALGLERLRYAARLYRLTASPILVSGGKTQGSVAEATEMKSVLVNELRIPVTWEESGSRTTFESAMSCRDILIPAGIKRIYLVTHAWHMRRAALAFQAAGFDVVPAPTGFTTLQPGALELYLPSPEGMFESYLFMHEVLGWFWYQIRLAVGNIMR